MWLASWKKIFVVIAYIHFGNAAPRVLKSRGIMLRNVHL
jgi:hypothetical protein